MRIKKNLAFLALLMCFQVSFAHENKMQLSQGKTLYEARCMMCHGKNAKASGPLAQKSNPATPDLTSCAYQKKLAQCPGRMVASIVLTPGGDLIPRTLKANNVILPPHTWTDKELRAINDYLITLVENQPLCVDPKEFTMHI